MAKKQEEVTPENIQPFAPPGQETLDNRLDPERLEAKELGDKLRAEKAPDPVGFEVRHEGVGPWSKGQRLDAKEVRAHFKDDPQTDRHIERLVSLGALHPFFESPPAAEPPPPPAKPES